MLDTRSLGRMGEGLAAEFLARRGWTLLGRNVRVGRREIDLIVTRGEVLAFVEVKTRAGDAFGEPLEAISFQKRQDVARAAAGWLREQGGAAGRTIRFDAVGVLCPGDAPPRVVHVPDAWRMG